MFNIAWVPYLKKMALQLARLDLRGNRLLVKLLIDNNDEKYNINNQYFNIMNQEDASQFMQLNCVSKFKLKQYLATLTELKIRCDRIQQVDTVKLSDIANWPQWPWSR